VARSRLALRVYTSSYDFDSMVFDGLAALFGGDDDDVDDIEGYDHDASLFDSTQGLRRQSMFDDIYEQAKASVRAGRFVRDIIRQNESRMQLDADGHLLVVGRLALYKVNLPAFLQRLSNPFEYTSFEAVEVHPKTGLVSDPRTACVQVQPQKNMPAADLLAGYLLGLMNDEQMYLEPHLGPLRRTLLHLYGITRSPLTPSLERHFANEYNGEFDFNNDTFTVPGTNGWKWRIHFRQPLTNGFKIEYQKPRQTWWNVMFEDHQDEMSSHHLSSFFDAAEHLSQCPAMLKTCNEWETDPIFLRKVATDYPPLARVLVPLICEEEYNPKDIHSDPWDGDYLSESSLQHIIQLDEVLRQRARV